MEALNCATLAKLILNSFYMWFLARVGHKRNLPRVWKGRSEVVVIFILKRLMLDQVLLQLKSYYLPLLTWPRSTTLPIPDGCLPSVSPSLDPGACLAPEEGH